ncbi:MYXO-CTERM domain-containing protein [Amycolatopsis arida]|uniref:MYXO-CTERM domain-containing protein n=1 Tax=Amycolatopsis arida TaxID=587909 RepID=A0A1I5UP30_9PSEU|nr:hypothetical protein [Amycolatopsis arida]TDX90975.1 MYXO-CTERM domain-containing protein [Amycolatopsis arida]SFP96972.1 MYXO-CTERM domain-containing protein [Amycolatopsis arida]
MTAPASHGPAPDGSTGYDEPRGLAELSRHVVARLYRRHPKLRLVAAVALGVLAAVCVAATVTRASPAPLIPLPALALAGYALHRTRRAADDRALLGWTLLAALGVAVCFWAMSIVARWLDKVG